MQSSQSSCARKTLTLALVAASFCTTRLTSQTPAHATLINPTTGYDELTFVQTEDVVHAFQPQSSLAMYARSADGGRTWTTIAQNLGSFHVQSIARDGNRMLVAGPWGNAVGIDGPRVVTSTNLGATWSPAQTASTWSSLPFHSDVRVHLTGPTALLLYTEPSVGAVWYRRSTDGGQTWPGPTQLLHFDTPPALSSSPMHLRMVADGSTVHVFWRARTALGIEIAWMQSSFDGGLTWLPNPRAMLPPDGPGRPIAAGNGGALIASNGGTLQHSMDAGMNWAEVSGFAIDSIVDVAMDGPVAAIVGRSNFTNDWNIQVSVDWGATWIDPPFVAAAGPIDRAEVSVVGARVYVDFIASHQPQSSVLVRSTDLGQSWHAVQFDVSEFHAGPRRNIHVRNVKQGVNSLMHAYVGLGYSTLGAGTAGTTNEVPTHSMRGLPELGSTASLDVANALGSALGVLGISIATPAATPFAGGTLWPQTPLVPLAFATSGSPGTGGAGSGSVALVVPNNPSLAGSSLTSQAVILDPAAISGFALSNAIDIWLR